MAIIAVKVPNAALEEVADLLWQSGRPTDPPVPPAIEPIVLTAEECIRRWIVREIKGRVHQWQRERAAQAAVTAIAEPSGIE